MKWYKITAPSPEALDKVVKSLREQRLMGRRRDGELFACLTSNHEVELSRVCQNFNATLEVLHKPPRGIPAPRKAEYVAPPCGKKFYDPRLYSQHRLGNGC